MRVKKAEGSRSDLAKITEMAEGIRSLSGVERITHILTAQGVVFTDGEEWVALIDRLIADLYRYAGSHPRPSGEVPEDLEKKELRTLTSLTLLRSGQNGVGGLDMVAAERDARSALKLAGAIDERPMITHALSHLGNTLLASQKPTEAAIIFAEEVGLNRKEDPPVSPRLVRSLYNLARAEIGCGNRAGARATLKEGLGYYDDQESAKDLPLFGKALLLQIWQDLHEEEHDPEVTLEIARQSIEILELLDMPERLIPVRLGVIRLHLLRNDAIGYAKELLAIRRDLREEMSPFLHCQFRVAETAVYTALQNFDRAEEKGIEGLATARSIGNRIAESIILDRLAEIAQLTGRLDSALFHSDAALKIENHPVRRAYLLRLRADILLDLGKVDEARTALDEGREMLGVGNRKPDRGYFDYTEGRYALATGEIDRGIILLEQIESYPLAPRSVLIRGEDLLAETFEKEGRLPEALASYKRHHQRLIEQMKMHRAAEELLAEQAASEQKGSSPKKKGALTHVRKAGQEESIIAVLDRLKSLAAIENQAELREEIDEIARLLQDAFSEKNTSLVEHLRHVETDFIDRLTAEGTSLTPGQTRLALLIRSGLRSREITTLLNITTNTLAMQRKRLRKKLGLHRDESLEEKIRKT